MSKILRILVPIDFSESSKAAAQYALFLAKNFDASINIVHIWEQPYYFDSQVLLHTPGQTAQTITNYIETQAKTELKQFIEALNVPKNVILENHFLHGMIYSKIIDLAKEGYDLIVMGTHGRSGVAHLLLGSVAEKVLRHAPCPVVTIKGPSEKK
ncbi:MAG: universal stress protein [Planctomycetota bacterium]